MKLSELLSEAADYLAKHGHCKGDLRTQDGRVCLSGAIAGALMDRGEIVSWSTCDVPTKAATLWNEAGYAIAAEVEGVETLSGLPDWNDAPETSQEDVLLAMKRAAHKYEEKGR